MHDHDPLLSALLPTGVNTPLQPSSVNPPPLPQILDFSRQRDVPPLKPLSVCDPPPLLYVSLQGRGGSPLIPSTVCTHVHLIYDLLLW